MDGVTTALELEVAVSTVREWYTARKGKSLIHFGTHPTQQLGEGLRPYPPRW
jgi:hypothetical protein